MIDCKPQVYKRLCEIGLPCYYEVFLTKDTELPCISYYEMDNISDKEGDTLGYSSVRISTKVWGKDIKTISKYCGLIDEAMRELGFKRVTSNEVWLDGIGQKQLVFQATGFENFD